MRIELVSVSEGTPTKPCYRITITTNNGDIVYHAIGYEKVEKYIEQAKELKEGEKEP